MCACYMLQALLYIRKVQSQVQHQCMPLGMCLKLMNTRQADMTICGQMLLSAYMTALLATCNKTSQVPMHAGRCMVEEEAVKPCPTQNLPDVQQ